MKLKPLFDNVVLKRVNAEVTTASGILLAGAEKEKPQVAEVVAVGAGAYVDGKTLPMQVSVGDKVIFPQYAGNQFRIDGEDLIVVTQKDILAIIDK